MIGSLGLPEMILLFALALIIFGPRRLPEIGRTLGKAMGEFKKASNQFRDTLEREVKAVETAVETSVASPSDSGQATPSVAATISPPPPAAAAELPAPNSILAERH